MIIKKLEKRGSDISKVSKSLANLNTAAALNSYVTGGDASQPEQCYASHSKLINTEYDGKNKSLRNRLSKSVTNH